MEKTRKVILGYLPQCDSCPFKQYYVQVINNMVLQRELTAVKTKLNELEKKLNEIEKEEGQSSSQRP